MMGDCTWSVGVYIQLSKPTRSDLPFFYMENWHKKEPESNHTFRVLTLKTTKRDLLRLIASQLTHGTLSILPPLPSPIGHIFHPQKREIYWSSATARLLAPKTHPIPVVEVVCLPNGFRNTAHKFRRRTVKRLISGARARVRFGACVCVKLSLKLQPNLRALQDVVRLSVEGCKKTRATTKAFLLNSNPSF